jgi:hypothetical protein
MKNKLLLGLAILSLLFSGTNFGQAQDQQQDPQQDQDQNQSQPVPEAQQAPQAQPSVARISMIHGEANRQRGDSGEVVAGSLNSPVVAGDRLITGTRSRLELTLDFANFLRLDERTDAKIADLTRTHIQVQVSQGIVNYTVFNGNEADIEIDTPNVAIHPVREGRYRIQITSDELSEIIVRDGELEITTPQGSTRIHKGQMITVRGLDNPEFQTADAPHNDSWDDWNKDRDRQVQDAASWSHTNRYYTGANDLDAYGHWTYAPGYGDVWVPDQGEDWAPYRDGRWSWEPYWGWTWVSYEPWGWAPYHYGRWFVNAGAWCWWPGPVYRSYRPFWSPAYVSFFGFSGRHFGIGVGFGFGSVGWLPIGPGDGFYPWWGGYRRNSVFVSVNNFNNFRGGRRWDPLWNGRGRGFSNIDGAFRDGRLRNGVTTMRADQFGRGSVRRDFTRVSEADFRGGRMVAGSVPVVPTRESLRSSDRNANPGISQGRGGQDRFFTRSTPRGSPESFQSGQSQMRDLARQQQTNGGAQGVRQTSPASGQPQQQGGGWQRFGNRGNPPQQGQRNVQGRGSDGRQRDSLPAGRGNVQSPANPQQGGQGRGNSQPQAAPRQNNQPAANPQQGGWQRFSPNQQRPRPQFGDSQRGNNAQRNSGRWGQSDSSRGSGRPELNLQRPIMTPRPSPPDRGNSGGRMSPPPPPSSPRGGYAPPDRGNGGGRYSPPPSSPRPAPSASPRGGGSASPRGGSSVGPRGGTRGGGGSSRPSSGSSGGRGGRPH